MTWVAMLIVVCGVGPGNGCTMDISWNVRQIQCERVKQAMRFSPGMTINVYCIDTSTEGR